MSFAANIVPCPAQPEQTRTKLSIFHYQDSLKQNILNSKKYTRSSLILMTYLLFEQKLLLSFFPTHSITLLTFQT